MHMTYMRTQKITLTLSNKTTKVSVGYVMAGSNTLLNFKTITMFYTSTLILKNSNQDL